MMTMTMGRATPRPLTRQVRGGVTGWTLDGLLGSLPSGVAFSRASGGGYFNASGIWTVAGTDVARFDCNPDTLAPRGLLVEGQRTNLLLHCRDMTQTAWTKTNMTTAKTATGIDGTTNSATRLTATSSNATVLQAVTSGSAVRAVSAYVRRVSGSGTVEMTQNGGTNWTAVTLTGSWTRVGPASATITNPSVGFRLGTNGDVIEVDYVQLETATFASSAIATTTSSVTRAGDIPVVSALADIGFNSGEGTVVAEFDMAGLSSTLASTLFSLDDGSETNRIYARINFAASGVLRVGRFDSGSGSFSNTVNSYTPGTVGKVAVCYKANDYAFCLNGGTVATAAVSVPVGLNTLRLGYVSGGNEPAFMVLRRFAYSPTRLPNGQLQALTQ